MFRIAKTLDTGEAAYFMLCDHRQCMDARRGPAVVANVDDYRFTKGQFLKAAIEEGWLVDLEGIFCPIHARELVHAVRTAQEKGKKIVEPVGPQIAAFGRAAR